MTISGFSMAKNADKLYYPIKEAIMSVLPIVDEFIVAIGDCDADDKTRQLVESINDPKVKIIDTVWDIKKYDRGTENAHQSNIAKKACKGDWLLYLQADEVIHEKYLGLIKEKCQHYLENKDVEGFLFKYRHFWGDYNHCHNSHCWYKNEIRIVRNHPDIFSWESAQSFRRIPNFDEVDHRQQKGTYKLNVIETGAEIYHYGWVRPPKHMKTKMKALDTIHKGQSKAEEVDKKRQFDYGPLNKIDVFEDTHPKVMQNWIEKFDWQQELQYSGGFPSHRKPFKHERHKYRLVSWIENNILMGRSLGGFKNYNILRNLKI